MSRNQIDRRDVDSDYEDMTNVEIACLIPDCILNDDNCGSNSDMERDPLGDIPVLYEVQQLQQHEAVRGQLRNYRKVHMRQQQESQQRPLRGSYVCSYCPKVFSQSGNLANHVRTHTGERPFRCPHCDRSFSQSGNLQSHIRLHRNERPYQCPHCSRGFVQSGNLASHIRNNHIERKERQMEHQNHDMHQHNGGHHEHMMMDGASTTAPDHSAHTMMAMFFHFGYKEVVLFESWSIGSVGGLIGSMVGIFFMAALYEGLKYYREFLFWRTYNALQYRAVNLPQQEKTVVTEDNQVVQPTMLSLMHGYQTFLHMVQMVLSYFLMLIFMTYNVWLCVAVVLGAASGYFLFGWKKSVIVDVTEHCH